jgi:transposase
MGARYGRVLDAIRELGVALLANAKPLRAVESEFAVDSSGFSSSVYKRWFDAKYGRERTMGGYVKAHVMVGVTTNVVVSVEVTPPDISDYEIFAPLVKSAALRFDISRLSADKAYSGRSNLALVDSIGAVPFVPFRSNAKQGQPSLWQRMYDYFHENTDQFYRHYHQRSNVETTFHMIKSKFGGFVRSKTPTAQVNEVLCKVLCHNLCCLVSAFYELGIAPRFWQGGTAALMEERAPSWRRNLPPRTPWRHGGPQTRIARARAARNPKPCAPPKSTDMPAPNSKPE